MAKRTLTIRVGRTFKLGRFHVGLWRRRFWQWAIGIATPTSWFVLYLGPVSFRIAR